MMPISSSLSHRGAPDAGKWYTVIARWFFAALVFFVPLTVLPWTIDPLEINKQFVFLILGSGVLLALLGRTLARKSITARVHPAFIFLGIFLVISAISSGVSSASYTSWMGSGGQEYVSFLTLGMAGLLALVAGSIEDKPATLARHTVLAALCGSAVVGLLVALGALGVSITSTGFIGTPNAIGIYLIALSTLGCAAVLFAPKEHRSARAEMNSGSLLLQIATIMTGLATIIVLLAIDYWVLWTLLLFGMGLLFLRVFSRAEHLPRLFALFAPMVLSVCAVLFLILPSPLTGVFPVEISPSYGASWDMTTASLSERSWLVGAGPGTFVEAYTKFLVPEINETNFWDVRFDRPSSHVLALLHGFGFLGLLFLLLWLGWIFVAGVSKAEEESDDMRAWRQILWSGWIVFAAGAIVYSSNMTLTVLFFLFGGLILGLTHLSEKTVVFSESPRAALGSTFASVFVSIAVLTLLFVTLSRYGAEIVFARSVAADRSGADIEEVLLGIDTAARLNRWDDNYYRNLAHAIFVKVSKVAQDPSANPDEIRSLVSASINAARRATELAPNQVVNWALLGDVYREIAPIAGGADAFSVAAYERAITLAPSNPKYYVSAGRAYLAQAEGQGAYLKSEDKETAAAAKEVWDAALVQAITQLTKATQLKTDYAPAHYYLAAAYERQGNLSEAISRMEEVRQTAPNDVGVALQLGLLYLRQGKIDSGQTELERAVQIAPNFSNARWFLSAIYEQKGEYDKALEQVEEVVKYNPDNELVKQRIQRLTDEKAAAETPPPAVDTTPLEEGEETGGVTTP